MAARTTILALALLTCTAILAPAGQVQDVYFQSTDGAFLFGGLRVPEGKGPFPALILIHGRSGGMEIFEVRNHADPESSSPTIREFAKRDIMFRAGYNIQQEMLELL